MSYSCPQNKEQYWNVVDMHWANLYNILAMFLPSKYLAEADRLRLMKDPKLVSLFNDAWWNAPDSGGIHSIPDWKILCDLCSEASVLYDESENIND